MTPADIIRMAREAGFRQRHNSPIEWHMVTEDIERFAALVAAAEREECAKICDEAESAHYAQFLIRRRGTP